MKSELKLDLIMFYKLQDDLYKTKIWKAFYIFEGLEIQNKKIFYKYKIYFNDLDDFSYEEILSFKRLKDKSYFDIIKELYKEIMDNSSIIHFPKIN